MKYKIGNYYAYCPTNNQLVWCLFYRDSFPHKDLGIEFLHSMKFDSKHRFDSRIFKSKLLKIMYLGDKK